MEFFFRFDINFFSIFLLMGLLGILYFRKDIFSYSSKIFRNLILVNIFVMAAEVISWYFDGKLGVFEYYMNYIFAALYFILSPLMVSMWTSYFDYQVVKSDERLRKRIFYIQPVIFLFFLIIINIFKPIIFSIDSNNMYSRETYTFVTLIISVIAYIYIIALVYKHRQKIKKKIVYSILGYVFIPIIATILQVKFYGILIIWPTMSVVIVIVYFFLETNSSSKDYLTGIYNRIRVDEFIEYSLLSKKKIGLLMFDLNDFKLVNDRYGHLKGDEILIIFAKALKYTFKSELLVARYAGDEFIVVTKELNHNEVLIYREKLEETIDISFSMGYYFCDKEENRTYEYCLNAVDKKMYENKRQIKEMYHNV